MTAAETFMGFDSAEWTAIGTVALTAVTIIYVVITWRISKSAAESAASAADAATRSARIAEAALEVDFKAEYDRESSALGNRWIVLECTGSKVFLHGAELYLAVYFVPGDDQMKLASGEMEVDDPERLPALLHRGEWAHLKWSHSEVDPERHASGQVSIEYSLDADGPTRRICRVIDFGASEDQTLRVV